MWVMTIISPAFEPGEEIPVEYTCDGENLSPPLEFYDVPKNTKSLALILDDPDAPAGVFTHWVVWNISPETPEIEEGVPVSGAVEGVNSAGRTGYTGPCPPTGTHHYYFRLYALSDRIDLPNSSTREELDVAMEDLSLAEAEMMGTYGRV